MPYQSRFFLFLLTSIILSGILPFSVGAEQLKKISISNDGNETVVYLLLDKIPRYSTHQIKSLNNKSARCYIDLFSSFPTHEIPNRIDLNNEQISRVRTGRHGTMLRVVLDLTPQTSCSILVDKSNSLVSMRAQNYQPESLEKDKTYFTDNPLSRKLPQNIWQKPNSLPTNPSLKSETPSDISESDIELDIQSLFEDTSESKFSFFGWVKGYSATDTKKDDYEDHSLHRARTRLGGSWENNFDNSEFKIQLSADIEHIFYDNNEADEDTDIDLYEAYAQWNFPKTDLTLGKQRVRWGKGDQLSPLDNINPEDTRQFIAVPLEESKLSSWLIRSRYFFNDITVEGIIDPWFEKSKIDYFDSDWSLYRNLRQAIMENSAVPLPLQLYAKNMHVHEETPEKSLENVSGALRIAWQTDTSDFAFSGRYGWETTPTITSFPVKNINYQGKSDTEILEQINSLAFTNESIESKFKRQTTIGFEWETVLDQIGFRGEVAFIDKVSFLNNELTSTRKSVSQLVAGIDYTTSNEWYLNIQTSWYKIYGFNSSLLYVNKDNLSLLGEVSRPFWRGNFEFSTKFNYTITDKSSYLQPALRVKYFTNTVIEAGAMIFSGDTDTMLGSYDQADQIYCQVKYSF